MPFLAADVDENRETSASLQTVTATDADSRVSGFGLLNYSIEAGTGSDSFSITDMGVLSVIAPLDREAMYAYSDIKITLLCVCFN